MRSEIDKVWTRFRSTLTLERKGEKMGDRPSYLKCRTLKHLNIVAACAEMRQGAALPCPDAVRRTVSETLLSPQTAQTLSTNSFSNTGRAMARGDL
jgi:hypothetical protein